MLRMCVQLRGTRHRERQHEPVSLGQGQRVFGRLVRRALVPQLPVGQPGQQMSLYHRVVPDNRCGPVQYIPQGGERPVRIAVRQADHRAGVADLARYGPLAIQRRERRTGLIGHPEAGLGSQQPARHPARQRERAHQLRFEAFGGPELLKRFLVASPTDVQHPEHQM